VPDLQRLVLVAITGDRLGVNLISAVTAKGKLRFAAYDGHLNASVFIDFCRRLLHDAPSPVFCAGRPPGAPVQGGQGLCCVDRGRLRLCFLPGYAPG
jgi:hypothetical protein